LNNWAVIFTRICNNLRATLDWFGLQNLCGLPNIARLVFPYKEERNTFEGINEREKEMLNEILMMHCFKII
jgi:hypothetical protein